MLSFILYKESDIRVIYNTINKNLIEEEEIYKISKDKTY